MFDPFRKFLTAEDLSRLIGMRIRGEVEVVAQASEDGIADWAADEGEALARLLEYLSDLERQRRLLAERISGDLGTSE